jgi:hypothetical protein
MCMDETQAPERFSPDRKTVEFRDENAVGVSDYYMSDRTASVDDNSDLLPDFRRKANEITGELLCDDLVARDSATVDLPD